MSHASSNKLTLMVPPNADTASVPFSQARSARAALISDYITLTKPRITMMVLITAYIGFALGASGLVWSWWLLLATLVGTGLTCMGSAVLNQVYERDTDGLMPRTSQRPLPAGRIRPTHAVIYGLALAAIGLLVLALFTTWLAVAACLFTIAGYTLIYTPLKRVHWSSTHIGAIPGAMPPVIGYCAAADDLSLTAAVIFAIMFIWQIPHFLAIVWLYREDYARAGLPLLGVIDPDGKQTFFQILITCIALLPLGLLPTFVGISGWWYFAVALLAGLVFLIMGIALIRQPSRSRARALFLASLVYLPVVLVMMLVDKT